jgi:hypothetical protein
MKKKIINKLKTVLNKDKPKAEPKPFPGSEAYWEKRYKSNDNSGPGSYGRLAKFKAEILNAFVKQNKVLQVVEYGSGDGNQLKLAEYPSYIGIDVSQTALELCKEKFGDDSTKKFLLFTLENSNTVKGELVLSLDVIYHLVEDEVFENYMKALFNSSTKYVIIYSSNYDKVLAKHVRCRNFTDWVDEHLANQWTLIETIPNKFPFDEANPDHTSMSDFFIYQKNNT